MSEFQSYLHPVAESAELAGATQGWLQRELAEGFSAWLNLIEILGAESGLSQLRLTYALLGAFSLLSVFGAFIYGWGRVQARSGKILLYICALHGVFALFGTRALAEGLIASL